MVTMPPEPSIIAPAYSFNVDKYLEAWGEVQSGNEDELVGLHGEGGRYQIKPALWKEHCSLPFSLCKQYSNSRVVMMRILTSYLVQAKQLGCMERDLPDVITHWLACGRSFTTVSAAKRSEIRRVLNLYELAL